MEKYFELLKVDYDFNKSTFFSFLAATLTSFIGSIATSGKIEWLSSSLMILSVLFVLATIIFLSRLIKNYNLIVNYLGFKKKSDHNLSRKVGFMEPTWTIIDIVANILTAVAVITLLSKYNSGIKLAFLVIIMLCWAFRPIFEFMRKLFPKKENQ
ncbi:Uncharacterised protein [uncultured archaeon]|nr:Uncharacterised protein [uncultured archaeon]